jgi:hypothetical protein
MAAPTNTALVKKVLANSEPSTHGPERHFAAPNNNVAIGVIVLQNPGAFYGSTGFEHC